MTGDGAAPNDRASKTLMLAEAGEAPRRIADQLTRNRAAIAKLGAMKAFAPLTGLPP